MVSQEAGPFRLKRVLAAAVAKAPFRERLQLQPSPDWESRFACPAVHERESGGDTPGDGCALHSAPAWHGGWPATLLTRK
jgi:hypothetical protein